MYIREKNCRSNYYQTLKVACCQDDSKIILLIMTISKLEFSKLEPTNKMNRRQITSNERIVDPKIIQFSYVDKTIIDQIITIYHRSIFHLP